MDFILTPTVTRTSGSGSTAANLFAVSIANVGLNDDAEVLGTILKKGEVVSFEARTGYGLDAIDYDAGTSELLITTLGG